MKGTRSRQPDITPDLLLRAYSIGLFPMADSADDPELFWVEPELRGIIPLDDFHVSKKPGQDHPPRAVRYPLRHGVRTGDGRMCRPCPGSPHHVDQRQDPFALCDAAQHGPRA